MVHKLIELSSARRINALISEDDIVVRDAVTNRERGRIAAPPHEQITAAAFSSDGTRIGVGTNAGNAYIYDVTGDIAEDAKPLLMGINHPPESQPPIVAPVSALACSSDGHFWATASTTAASDIHLWSAAPEATSMTRIGGHHHVPFVAVHLTLVRLHDSSSKAHVMCVSAADECAAVSFKLASLPRVAVSDLDVEDKPVKEVGGWATFYAKVRSAPKDKDKDNKQGQGTQYYLQKFNAEFGLASTLIERYARFAWTFKHERLLTAVAVAVDDRDRAMFLVYDRPKNEVSTIVDADVVTQLKRLHQIAEALEYLHKNGCVHGNVCPTSVFASGKDAARLGGFEYAAGPDFPRVEIPNAIVRLDDYLAPEVKSERDRTGTGISTEASDVYSFGRTMFAIIHKKPLASLMPDRDLAGSLIARCCHNDSKQRPTMKEVVAQLQDLLLRQSVSSALFGVDGLIQRETDIHLKDLAWRSHEELLLADVTKDAGGTEGACYRFVKSYMRDSARLDSRISRITMVGSSCATIDSFLQTHRYDDNARGGNTELQIPNTKSAIPVAELLKSSFVDVGKTTARTRLLLGWHGAALGSVCDLCLQKPRNKHTTDAGYFGSGLYFALEPWYAAQYPLTVAPNAERAVVLFAISVSQTKCITVEDDYRTESEESKLKANLHGFSKFYSGSKDTQIALARLHDSHFIPVKDYQNVHPKTGATLRHNVGYQACAPGDADAHEVVISSHHKCVPIAIVYLDPALGNPEDETHRALDGPPLR